MSDIVGMSEAEIDEFVSDTYDHDFDAIPHVNIEFVSDSDHDHEMSNVEIDGFVNDIVHGRVVDDDEIPHVDLQFTNYAFGRRIREFDLVNKGLIDINGFLSTAFGLYQHEINDALSQFGIIKAVSFLSQNSKEDLVVMRTAIRYLKKELLIFHQM